MNTEDWESLQRLFERAMELPREELAVFLERECGDNEELRSELESMLQQDVGGSTRIQQAIKLAANDLDGGDSDPWIGTLVGSYRVVDRIAEGGMGVVYIGERADEQYRQRVAIKILNFGQMSSAVRARFLAERQILANLHHPNIAGLVDGGATGQGVPYLVMEYIDGVAIDRYCNEHRLTVKARLQLFLQVCAAVQYAHQNLVVHRDIKPGNILVDEHGAPKLLDFGIAKLLEPDSLDPETGQLTRADMRLLTPEFASPEQVRGEKVTTATDVYALGLLLYRLLAGDMPYRFASYSPADIAHAVCDTKPDRPSTVAERAGGTSFLPDAESSPARWASQLKGDLDNIVLLTLRKEPEQRYATVRQLADDIQRYLDQRPVLAQPASMRYLAGKFIARNRTAVISVSLVASLVIGLVSYYTLQLAVERDRAQIESRKATEVSAFLTGLFKLSDPAEMKGESISARELLDRGARRIEYELAGQPEVQATMTRVMGRNYRNLGLYDQAQALFLQSVDVFRGIHGNVHSDTLASRNDLGLNLVELGKYEEAYTELQAVMTARLEHGKPSRLDFSITQRSLGIALIELGDYEQAEQQLMAALALQRELSPSGSLEIATTLSTLGRLYTVTGNFPDAKTMLEDSVAMHISVHGREHPDTLKALNALGTQYLNHGEVLAARETFEEVLELRRKLLGPRHISVGRVLGNLGTVNYHMGSYRDAMEYYIESLDILREALGDEHPGIAFLKENIANVYLATGQQDLAYDMYLESIARMRDIFGEVHIETGMTTSNVGGALVDMERFAEARPHLIEADRIFRETLGEDHAFVANNMLKLGQSEQGMAQYATAEATYRQALALAGQSLAPEHPDILKMQYALADALMLQGKLEQSEALLQTTLSTWRGIELGGGSFTARTAGLLGDCLTRMRRFEEAEIYLLESLEALASIQGEDHKHRVEARQRLASLYLAWDRPAAAETYQ